MKLIYTLMIRKVSSGLSTFQNAQSAILTIKHLQAIADMNDVSLFEAVSMVDDLDGEVNLLNSKTKEKLKKFAEMILSFKQAQKFLYLRILFRF